MFWNARGLRDCTHEVIEFMSGNKVGAALFMETSVYGTDLSQGRWKWLAGPELLPLPGGYNPRLGLGALVDTDRYPGASVVKKYKRSMWLRLPGESRDLYVCAVHLPLYTTPRERAKAICDLVAGYNLFKNKGLVVYGGDFNARCGMNGDSLTKTSGRHLFSFCKENSLTIVNSMDICSGEFTRVQDVIIDGLARTNRTTIDYVLVPSLEESSVLAMQICDESDLDSDHRPVVVTLSWDRLNTTRLKTKPTTHRKWKVHETRPAAWSAYEDMCERQFVPWIAAAETIKEDSPPSQLQQKSKQNLADALAITFRDGLEAAAEQGVGSKLVSKRSKPWVDRKLSSLFKLRSLTSSLCSFARHCAVDAITNSTKALHGHVKRLVRSTVRSNRIASDLRDIRSIEAAPHGSKLFWTKWKARVRSLGKSGTPECVIDPDGKLVTEPLKVLRVWKDFVQNLGKEAIIAADPGDRASNDDSPYDDGFAQHILDSLKACRDDQGVVTELDTAITWHEVHAAVRALSNGKCPGTDGIPPELLFNGGIALELALTELFNFMWLNNVWPEEWRMAILIPLYKGAGTKLDPSNHRMLAMMSVIAKLFETVLNVRLRKWSERVGILSDLQGGFRERRGTVDQMLILNEMIAKRWHEGRRPIFLTFIDVRKAYDRVWRPGLWFKLREAGVGGRMLAMLREMYKTVSRSVLINGRRSETFQVEAGVPQGAVLSPFLYATYINGLHDALRSKGLGIMLYGRLVPLLLYADDVVLLSKNATEARKMHNVVSEYARKWRFDINHEKTNLVVFGPKVLIHETKAATWTISGKPFGVVDYYKYLGAEVGATRGKWNRLLQRLHDATRSHMNLLLWQGGGRRGLRARTLAHQWSTTCRPKAEYACELWEGETSEAWVTTLESLQTTFCKAVLGFKRTNPAAVGMRMELSLRQLKIRRQMLKLLYWKRLCVADSTRLLSLIFRKRHVEALGGGARHSWFQAMKSLLLDWGFRAAWRNGSCHGEWEQRVREVAADKVNSANKVALSALSSLSVYSTLSHASQVAPYLDDRYDLNALWLKTSLRLGNAWLMKRVAKALGWPVSGGACPLCRDGSIENVPHFLTACKALSLHRHRLVSVLEARLSVLGTPGSFVLGEFRNDTDTRLKLILASDVQFPVCPSDQDERRYDQLCAMTLWSLDKASKNFIAALWQHRRTVLGDLTVVGGKLVRTPVPCKASPSPTVSRVPPRRPPDNFRQFWSSWLTYIRTSEPKPIASTRDKKGRYDFYNVWRGNKPGVYYKWSDCQTSIRGHPDPGVKGFATLEAAYAHSALRRSLPFS